MDHIGFILAAKTVEGTRLHFSGDLTWWMAAILAGARHVQGSLNGLGERCGNADLVKGKTLSKNRYQA